LSYITLTPLLLRHDAFRHYHYDIVASAIISLQRYSDAAHWHYAATILATLMPPLRHIADTPPLLPYADTATCRHLRHAADIITSAPLRRIDATLLRPYTITPLDYYAII